MIEREDMRELIRLLEDLVMKATATNIENEYSSFDMITIAHIKATNRVAADFNYDLASIRLGVEGKSTVAPYAA